MKLQTYCIYSNMMFDVNHVERFNWWRHLSIALGWQMEPFDTCEAVCRDAAVLKFRKKGYNLGFYDRVVK